MTMHRPSISISLVLALFAWSLAASVASAQRADSAVLLTRASTPALMRACNTAARWPGGAATRWQHPQPIVQGADAGAMWSACFALERLEQAAAPDGGTDEDRRQRYELWAHDIDALLPRAQRAEQACHALESAVASADLVTLDVATVPSTYASQAVAWRARLEAANTLFQICAATAASPSGVPTTETLDGIERLARALRGVRAEDRAVRVFELRDTLRTEVQSGSTPEEAAAATTNETQRSTPTLESMALVILQGLADFLVSRAQREIQTFVIDRIRDEVCTPESGESERTPEYYSARLLRNTCAFLGGRDFTFAAILGASFRSAVMADVLGLPSAALDITACDDPIATRCDLPLEEEAAVTADTAEGQDVEPPVAIQRHAANIVLRLGLRLVALMLEGSDPRTVLDGLASHFEEEAITCGPFASLIHAIGSAITGARLGGHNVTMADVMNMIRVAFPDGAHDDDAALVAQHVIEWIDAIERVRNATTATPSESLTAEVLRTRALSAAGQAVASGLLVIGDILRIAEVDTSVRIPDWVGPVLQGFLSDDPARMVASGVRMVSEVVEDAHLDVPVAVVRLVTLGGELAVAEDREAVAEVLDQFAAPVGSWRAKTDHLTVSIDGLLGLGGGGEYAVAVGGHASSFGGYGGLVGLVGVDIAGPTDHVHGPSLGAFFSLLDVGALVTLGTATPSRCVDQTTMMQVPATGDTCPAGSAAEASRADPISPLQFVAPGLFFRVGLRDVPFVFGAGIDVLPWGRTLHYQVAGADTSEMIPIVRFGAFAAVDVTILEL